MKHTRRGIERRQVALGYAWGRQDAGESTDLDASAFAEFHANQADAYDREERGDLPSVMAAWREFGGLPKFGTPARAKADGQVAS